ncbi:uncharacterized protein LOC18441317 [Amborella trichopoda]|uniref:uncharacterized protein LOC18441317 n=1 Tax=Amborella trichopoda TaxID=13333 RepID=UPI0005D2FF64|nr:uncharacterized protein LOC18441317 [Amborella trichopoda]|eukprot:XP_011625961.1 uncharacterized protein LOC18441317 [Amborella trichopoda]
MGKKQGKKHGNNQRRPSRCVEEDSLPSSAYDPNQREEEESEEEREKSAEEEGEHNGPYSEDNPSKFLLYQKSVQSPKGDISYLQKFFLTYIGGRFPLHLREDFCGTALLSAEWIHSDARRTAIGVDLDLEALTWCLENNIKKVGFDGYSRIFLYNGNVLQPHNATLVKCRLPDSINSSETSTNEVDPINADNNPDPKEKCQNPARDIICAFNYSCCCLQKREDLVLYFKHALSSLSKKGGIFVMDLYGGTSSERPLRIQRRYPNFTYIWEQEEFDALSRTTRISLHFNLGKKGTLRHAFSYNWRLWSLPEIKACLEEAGFQHVHFWMRQMSDTQGSKNTEFNRDQEAKYVEVSSFKQRDSWNAYIVAVP